MAGLKLLKFVRFGTELMVARTTSGDQLRVAMKHESRYDLIDLNVADMRELRDMLDATIEHAEQVWESRERIRLTAAEIVEPKPEPEQPAGLPEA